VFKIFWRVGLAVFLILWGLISMDVISFDNSGTILGIIAIATGVLVLMDK
jgi:biotin synthase-related radical SAM superfamily protein